MLFDIFKKEEPPKDPVFWELSITGYYEKNRSEEQILLAFDSEEAAFSFTKTDDFLRLIADKTDFRFERLLIQKFEKSDLITTVSMDRIFEDGFEVFINKIAYVPSKTYPGARIRRLEKFDFVTNEKEFAKLYSSFIEGGES